MDQSDFESNFHPPRLSDDVIALAQFTQDDVEAHVAGDDIEQARWLNGGHPSTTESTRAWIERNAEYWRRGGPVFNFAIRTMQGDLVGMVEANTDSAEIDGLQAGDANISYALYPEA